MIESREGHREIMFLCTLPLKWLVQGILNVQLVLLTKVCMYVVLLVFFFSKQMKHFAFQKNG